MNSKGKADRQAGWKEIACSERSEGILPTWLAERRVLRNRVTVGNDL